MNLQQLYYFRKIAECEQYTLAAEELHVTQAALSVAITNLEKELNVQLFNRKGKKISLTECGKAYLSCVCDALAALNRGEEIVRDMKNPGRGTIRIQYLESLNHLTMQLLGQWQENIDNPPKLSLLHENAAHIEEAIKNREADLAFSTRPSLDGIAYKLIGHQENVLVLSKKHPWADKEIISLEMLNDERFIAYTQDCLIRHFYDDILNRAGVVPNIVAESRLHSNILDLVSYNMGVAIMPHMQNLEDRTDLMSIPIKDEIDSREIYLLWGENAYFNDVVKSLYDYIMNYPDIECII